MENETPEQVEREISNVLGSLLRNYGWIEEGFLPSNRTRTLRLDVTNLDFLRDFYRAHEGFGEAQTLYDQFREIYQGYSGNIPSEECPPMENHLRRINLGDLDGLFTPLECASRSVYWRMASRIRDHYRGRILDAINSVGHSNPELSLVLEEGYGELPQELWQLHQELPFDTIGALRGIVEFESYADYISEDVVNYEYALVSDESLERPERIFLSGSNVGDRLNQDYSSERYFLLSRIPSLSQFRRMLPERLEDLLSQRESRDLVFDVRNHLRGGTIRALVEFENNPGDYPWEIWRN